MSTNPRLSRASKALSRRMFLKAMALGVSVPVALRLARIATAAATPAPKRFFVMYMPDGAPPEHYNPQLIGGDPTNFVLDKTNISILGPLQKYNTAGNKYVNVYQGFSYPGGETHTGIVSCLSGVPTTDITTPRTTLEHVIAKGLGVKPLILGACSHLGTGVDGAAMLFWDGDKVDPEKNPAAVADRLFGGGTPATPNADVQLRSDLLALTASEIDSLQGTLGGLTAEKTKLQRHLEAIQALQSGPSKSGVSTCTTAPSLPHVDMVRAGAAAAPPLDSSGGNDYFYSGANFQLIYQAQLEVAAQALICNAAQVIGLMPMWPVFELDFSFISPPGTVSPNGWSHHNGLSHTGPQAADGVTYNTPLSTNNLNPMTRSLFAQAQLWFANQLDQFVLQVLANTPDPSGGAGETVLDNTLVYWMSEIGDGQYHTTASTVIFQTPCFLPLVSIGKCGGGIQAGQVVQIAPDRPAQDLYLSFCQAMGVSNATFPGSTGPVSGIAT